MQQTFQRNEFKYILDYSTASQIEQFLVKVGMERDDYSGDGPYIVNSIYFDTPQLTDFREKDASLIRRKKVRVRSYEDSWWTNSTDPVWFEIKHKYNTRIDKVRTMASRSEWDSIFPRQGATGAPPVDGLSKEHDDFRFFLSRYQYSPQVAIKYKRLAFTSAFRGLIRVTFDSDLRAHRVSSSEDEKLAVPVFTERVIMEVKYAEVMPWWFPNLIKKHSLQRTDFSKYRNGYARLRSAYNVPVSR